MSLEAVVAFAPVLTHQAVAKADGRTLYGREAFRTIASEIPVVVDHDRRIGIVRSIGVMDDAFDLWHFARCAITDVPAWLKRGTGASLSYRPLTESIEWGYHVVREAILDEITVTSPAFTPRDPDARVLLLERTEHRPDGAEVVSVPYGAMIRRPNVGKILAVR